MDKIVKIGDLIEVYSVGGIHVYKIIEIEGEKVILISTTNPTKKLMLEKADLESGKFGFK
jgi:hypothetical protein